MTRIHLRHLGYSGLLVQGGDRRLAVDPPVPMGVPTVITWTERERVSGAGGSELAALPRVLEWLGLPGTPLVDGVPCTLGGAELVATPYRPIPYATLAEALRKARSGLAAPVLAARRLAFTSRRPRVPPLVVEARWAGRRVVFLGQALHRFLEPEELELLVERHGGADLAVAGTDYDDERATGALLARFEARVAVVADLVGEIRRRLGLPTRPLEVSLETAPAGTLLLAPHGEAVVELG